MDSALAAMKTEYDRSTKVLEDWAAAHISNLTAHPKYKNYYHATTEAAKWLQAQ
jgi:hypothetical protein